MRLLFDIDTIDFDIDIDTDTIDIYIDIGIDDIDINVIFTPPGLHWRRRRWDQL